MSRMLLTVLVFWAVAAPCWSHANVLDVHGQWDEGPCPQFRFSCYEKPVTGCKFCAPTPVDAKCRIICWNNPSMKDNKECQHQYFKRILCNSS